MYKFEDAVMTEAGRINFAAKMAAAENYEQLERYCAAGYSLNGLCTPETAYWEPTPLYYICSYKRYNRMKNPCKMLRFLVEHGADPNMPAGDGSTPLWNLCHKESNIELMRTLLELGADPNQTSTADSEEEVDPLSYALLPDVDENEEYIPYDEFTIKQANILLEFGAAVNAPTPYIDGFTPLQMAVMFGNGISNLPLVDKILKRKENTDEQLDEAMQIAVDKGFTEIEKLLLDYGVPKHEASGSNILFEGTFVEFIKYLRSDDSKFMPPPATQKDILVASTALRTMHLPVFPQDYAEFLKLSNGFAFNGVEIYGTEQFKKDDSNYILPDLITVNNDLNSRYELLLDKYLFWLGRVDEDLYVYNPETSKYEVRSLEDIESSWDEYDTFEEFFMEEIREKYI
ncbi:MAG: YrhA family protein [Culturomica sp.]|jgi:ankyrin repeat protein|nr:YrhA family protein [Culturomica sp.]